MKSIFAIILLFANLSIDEIILDIYNAASELGEVEYEQLQTDLYALHESPINLNSTSDEELQQLYFLSPKQIDDILLYADKHPFESLYELRMIPSLADYEIRDLLPFVRVGASAQDSTMYARDVFAKAHHELLARVDARNIEGFEGKDPIYFQTRYRFDYQRRVTFGFQLRRPEGGETQDLQHGAYLQIRNIGHLHSLVAGNYQAGFGMGLVFSPAFHQGKSVYVQSVGQTQEGLRYYSSVDGNGLHGAGATLRWEWNKTTRLDVSALYSLQKTNDSTWHHLVGANVTVRHKQLEIQVNAAENIWTDSIAPSRNTAYNQHYFRGYNQAVLGASARYNYGWFDAFAEIATTQNTQWGVGIMAGSRFYPTNGVSLVALYRYYSPWFDNALGYGFSESSRVGDENGGYLGFDITRLRRWRFTGYADVFYFSGPKYGIPDSCTIGYDVMTEARYHGGTSNLDSDPSYWVGLRLRARQKGNSSTYSARIQFNWQKEGWSLRTTGEGNYVNSYGITVYQDIAYSFRQAPVTLRGRVQFFDAREWANRIYSYEHDVLYAYSIPAVYGLGGKVYLCLKWQIIPQLALYFRISETIYDATWASAHDKSQTRTDLHLLLRAKL